ncbi:MAG TPA: hypothetical protein VJC12_03250 [Candidatus Paceibacterota bacterium]
MPFQVTVSRTIDGKPGIAQVLEVMGDAGGREDLEKLLHQNGFEQTRETCFWIKNHPIHGQIQAQITEVPEKKSLAYLPSLYGNDLQQNPA